MITGILFFAASMGKPGRRGEDLRKAPGCGPTEQICLCLGCRLLGQVDTFSKSWRWSREQKTRVLLVIFSLAFLSCTSQHHEKPVNIRITDEHSWRFYICHQKSRPQGVLLLSIMQPMLVLERRFRCWSSWSPWKSNDLVYRTYDQDMQW